MDLEKLKLDITNTYTTSGNTLNERVSDAFNQSAKLADAPLESLTFDVIKTVSTTLLELETKALHDELEALLAQKEQLERKLEKKI